MIKAVKNLDSIIFDLDGTLWDSREGVAKSWSEVLKNSNCERNMITVQEVNDLMGKTITDISKIILPDLEEDDRSDLILKCCKHENEYLRNNKATLFEGLEETLIELSKKYKLFIVSNCEDGYIETFLDSFDLHKYFIDFECPGTSGKGKSDNIKLIVDRNNLKNAIYVGDTQGDKDATKDAGLEFVYASYGFGKVDEFDYKIEKVSDLINL